MKKFELEDCFYKAKQKLCNKIYAYVDKKCGVKCRSNDKRFRFFPLELNNYDGFCYLKYKNNPKEVYVVEGEEEEEYTDELSLFSLDELEFIVESIEE